MYPKGSIFLHGGCSLLDFNKMIKRTCEVCNKEFRAKPYKVRDGKAKFCSVECRQIKEKSTISYKKCIICDKDFRYFPCYKKYKRGKLCSPKCQRIYQRDENNPFWSGDKIGYHGLHTWLIKKFGKALCCENPKCEHKPTKRYEWSLLKGKEYERKRENFWQLCVSCHRKYDMN